MRQNNTTILAGISQVALLDEVTVETYIEKDIEFELEHAERTREIIKEIGKGQKLFHLTIFDERSIPSTEARVFFNSEFGSHFKIAEAIVVQSLSQKMVFNFMINVEQPVVPTKLFTSIDDAKQWLHSLRETHQ